MTPTKTETAAVPDHQILAAAIVGVIRSQATAARVSAPLTVDSRRVRWQHGAAARQRGSHR